MKKRWILKENIAENGILIEGVNPLIRRILGARGIVSPDDVIEYLSEKPRQTHDPYLLKNMDRAVDAILSSVAAGKKICVYGDYDVDGISSVCLLMEFLGKLTDNLIYYIPSRFEEGYGLNIEAIDAVRERGAELLLTADCGTSSYHEVEYAKQIGMNVIVTDHHSIGESMADCILINPKQPDCRYPFKDLCGCGVAFKLAQAIQRRLGMPKADIANLLDLAALATVGDIVPLLGENRSLVKYGLEAINRKTRKGLAKLIDEVGIKDKTVKACHISYIIAPHLNAGGRILSAETGLRLLMSDDDDEISRNVEELIENNRLRKKIQDEAFEKCVEIVEKNFYDDLFLVIDAEDAHEGVIGIVAGKIKEKYCRPAIIVTGSREEGILKGTGRSIDSIDIYGTIKQYEDLFIKFGGHAGACGFKIEKDKIGDLRKNLNEEMRRICSSAPESFSGEIAVDAAVEIKDFSPEFLELLEKLEPIGHKNEKPVFMISNLKIAGLNYMGKNNEHVRLFLRDSKKNSIEAIFFNEAPDYSDILKLYNKIDIVGYPEINHWNGSRKVQFVICDMREGNL